MTGTGSRLVLPATADSAARARRHVREVLPPLLTGLRGGEGGEDVSSQASSRAASRTLSPAAIEAVVADAAVCISELVTNALLHAGTDVTITVRLRGEHEPRGEQGTRVRLEVRDGSVIEPQWIPRSLTASTGRGLALITALSAARGVDVHADGKTVWCELSTAPDDDAGRQQGPDAGVEAMDAVLAQEWSSVVAELEREVLQAPTPARGRLQQDETVGGQAGGQEPIRLLRYPLRRGVRMREHREAVLRELRLLTLTGAIADPATAALAEQIAQMLSTEYAGHLSPASAHVLQALVSGADSVDLEYPRLQGHQQLVEQWRKGLQDLERLSADGELATLATPPDVRELGRWVVSEFTEQLLGHRPRPWSGALD